MPKLRQIRAVATAVLLVCAMPRLGAQTLEEGLDHPTVLGGFATEATNSLTKLPIPSGQWVYDTSEFQIGGDSVVSTLPRASTSRISTSVQGPATVSFRWKTAADSIIDFLRVRVEGQVGSPGLGGLRDWRQQSVEVDCGVRKVEWEFERLGSVNQNNGKAWLDDMVVTPIPNVLDLQDALENSEYQIYSNDWVKEAVDGAINGFAAKSGELPVEGGTSSMMFEVQGPVNVSFKWGVETDPEDGSQLQFRVNDSLVAVLEGSSALVQRTLDLGPGTHCVKFVFFREGIEPGDYGGPVAGYVDHLVLTPIAANPVLAEAIEWTASEVYSNAWTPQAQVTRDGVDAASVVAPEVDRWRRLYIELPDGPGLLSFWTRLEIDEGQAFLALDLDRSAVMESAVAHGWKKTEVNLGPGSGRVLEALFLRSGSESPSSARGYLDLLSFLPGETNYQPDLAISPRGKPMRGVGIRNATGLRQVAVARPKLRRPLARFVLRVKNESPTDKDRVGIRGTGSRRHFRVLFVVKDGGQLLNFTSAFLSGRFTTLELASWASESHEIWISPKPRLRSRTHLFRATGRSTKHEMKVDAVRTRVVLPRR